MDLAVSFKPTVREADRRMVNDESDEWPYNLGLAFEPKHPISQAGGEMVRSAALLHRELVVPGVAGQLTHAQRREVLVDVQRAVETVQKVAAALIGGGGGMSEVDVHLDSVVRGLAMTDAGMCEAIDALGPVPGGKPVPSAVRARRRRLGLDQPGEQAAAD